MIEEAVRKYSDMIYRLALAKTGNPHDAEDLMQEVFLKLVTYGKTFNDEEHRKAWLIRVTINSGKNLMRKASLTKMPSTEEICEFVGIEDKSFSHIENKTVVFPVVMALDEKYRVVIHLFYYEDMPITEICKTTGLGQSTVKSRLHRARNILREKLKEVGFNEYEF